MTIPPENFYILLTIYTPTGTMIPIFETTFFWWGAGILSLLLSFYFYKRETSKNQRHLHFDVNNYSLSPATIAYFSHGVRKVEYALTATFLDWIRKGRIKNNILAIDGIELTDSLGPLLPDEEYLLHFLRKFEKNGIISFRKIRNTRRDDSQAFYLEMQKWFEMIDSNLKSQGFLMGQEGSKKQFLFMIFFGFVFLLVGFYGMSLRIWIAILLSLSGIFFILMGVHGYGAYPEKGQALQKTIKSFENNPDRNIFPKITTFIYSFGMGHKKPELLEAVSEVYNLPPDKTENFIDSHLNLVRETFLSGISMNLF